MARRDGKEPMVEPHQGDTSEEEISLDGFLNLNNYQLDRHANNYEPENDPRTGEASRESAEQGSSLSSDFTRALKNLESVNILPDDVKRIMEDPMLSKLALSDPRGVKRKWGSRQSSAKLRDKWKKYCAELENQQNTLQTMSANLSAKMAEFLEGDIERLTKEYNQLHDELRIHERKNRLSDLLIQETRNHLMKLKAATSLEVQNRRIVHQQLNQPSQHLLQQQLLQQIIMQQQNAAAAGLAGNVISETAQTEYQIFLAQQQQQQRQNAAAAGLAGNVISETAQTEYQIFLAQQQQQQQQQRPGQLSTLDLVHPPHNFQSHFNQQPLLMPQPQQNIVIQQQQLQQATMQQQDDEVHPVDDAAGSRQDAEPWDRFFD